MVSEGSEGTPPTCRIREPYPDGTFSGDVPVSATANDNVSVAYVQFQYSLDQVDWHALPAGEQDDPANDAKD